MSCPTCDQSNLSASQSAVVACQGATVIQALPDATLKMIAARVGAPTTGSNKWVTCLVAGALLTRRIIYFKISPGDCGQPTPIPLNATGQIAAGIGVATASDPEPISKGILSGISTIMGVFTAHHAAAVKTEQQTLCDVAITYNQYIDALEQALANGVARPEDAAPALNQIVTSLIAELAPITKSCNAACGYRYALQALQLYNTETIFPAIYKSPVQSVAPSVGTPGSQGVIIPAAPINNDLTGAVGDLLSGKVTATGLGLLAAAGLVIVAVR